ncbi:MAG: hypothetical protein HRU21_13230, partial [Pseudomonadales bacterium]|nr:hypothetical protein [Pseudomonadales bacterium]
MQINPAALEFLRSDFLSNHWQRQAAFLPQAIGISANDIDIDELAGLAMDAEVESRLIHQLAERDFSLQHGPFSLDTLTSLAESHWTLLIQSVDHILPAFLQLRDQFNFIDQARLDDIMVSISPSHGSVGPHFDHYDVFLIQAAGQREWQIGQACDASSKLVENSPLHILENFDCTQRFQCQPGDMLYLPPGLAHWGTASSDNCVTISIGFRSPSLQDIGQHLLVQATDVSKTDEVDNKENRQASKSSLTLSTLPIQWAAPAEAIAPSPSQPITQATLLELQQTLQQQLLQPENLAHALQASLTEPKNPNNFHCIDAQQAQRELQQLLIA